MGGVLRPCVDCGNPLSVTAEVCNQCNSTDPFGRVRSKDRLQTTAVALLCLMLLVIEVLWHFDFVDPVALLNGVIQILS